MHERWVTILSMLLGVGEIMIDRAVQLLGAEDVRELIAFSDGSLVAYACVVNIKWKKLKKSMTDPDRYHVKLVCGKARVTSVRGITAPRSEVWDS